jgi:mono/diheme cytochrome c family protein
MKLRLFFFRILMVSVIAGAGMLAAQNLAPNGGISTQPVFVPDASLQNKPLSAFDWDATMKTTNVPADAASAHLVFDFTNHAQQVLVTSSTNIVMVITNAPPTASSARWAMHSAREVFVTNVIVMTNTIPVPVIITQVHPSCGCTTAQLPPLPWTIAPGTNGEIGLTVNLAGKFGTVVKTVHVATTQGSKDLIIQINILPPVMRSMTDADRMRQMEIAKVDRQAVFKNDCASCHVKTGQFKFGKELFDADCGICHEAEHRASMVPDLHTLKVPTNEEFWRTWIAHGKPGTFMPAFSEGDGGPLSDMQIASLAAYLSAVIPSKVSPQKFQ